MKSLTYIGHVTPTGEIKLPKRVGSEVRRYFTGKDIQVSFSKLKKNRSNKQNAYYWCVVVRMVCEGFADLGNLVSPDSEEDMDMVHEFLKKRFLQPVEVADVNGEAHRLGYSTKRLSTSEMMDYIAQIQQFAAEYLNITIPDPGEQSQLWQ